jgi:hypothetical protein
VSRASPTASRPAARHGRAPPAVRQMCVAASRLLNTGGTAGPGRAWSRCPAGTLSSRLPTEGWCGSLLACVPAGHRVAGSG